MNFFAAKEHKERKETGRILALPPERRSPTRQVLKPLLRCAGSEIGAPGCATELRMVSRSTGQNFPFALFVFSCGHPWSSVFIRG